MKFASVFLASFLLLLCGLAFGATGERRIAGPPGQRVSLTRGDVAVIATTDEPGSLDALAAPPPPDTVHVKWLSGGVEVDVAIARQPGETNPGMAVRLAGLVNAMKVSFPVDPPAPSGG